MIYNANSIEVTLTPIPEPATIGLILGAAAALIGMRRRRK
ncbi:MAG: PEP-CTERM sorting domain-containing protein [Puniceicoccales bacterium]